MCVLCCRGGRERGGGGHGALLEVRYWSTQRSKAELNKYMHELLPLGLLLLRRVRNAW